MGRPVLFFQLIRKCIRKPTRIEIISAMLYQYDILWSTINILVTPHLESIKTKATSVLTMLKILRRLYLSQGAC